MVVEYSVGMGEEYISDGQVKKCKGCTCATCCLGWVITFIVLLSTSLKTLDQGQYALGFSHWDQAPFGDPMTDPGLKNIGPLNDLVRYPSVYQMVYFDDFAGWEARENEILRPPVHSRTYDGLQVFVKISFQWKLEPEHLQEIYRILGGAEDIIYGRVDSEKPSFVAALVRFARGTLTNICSQYSAEQFFKNQTLVEQTMFGALSSTFRQPAIGLNIAITGLQLRSVDLPDAYEGSIEETQKQEQDYQTAMAERATNLMTMERQLMQTRLAQQELLLDAKGNVTAIQEENRAAIMQYTNFQKKQAESYAALLATLANESDPFGALITMVKQKALRQHHTDKVTITM